MTGAAFEWAGGDLYVTRSGYTGEDGFEISLPADIATDFARALLAQPEVKPVGLGARNSLRLEAGLCLYGQDIDTTTTPVQAGLNWAIQKVRRTGGARAGGFPGAERVLAQLDGTDPLMKKRVGLIALERIPVREHAELQSIDGTVIGEVTSGLLGPNIDKPVAMGYVQPRTRRPGHPCQRHGAWQAGADGSERHAVCAQPVFPGLSPAARFDSPPFGLMPVSSPTKPNSPHRCPSTGSGANGT